MNPGTRIACALSAAALVTSLAACGGDDAPEAPETAPSPSPSPSPSVEAPDPSSDSYGVKDTGTAAATAEGRTAEDGNALYFNDATLGKTQKCVDQIKAALSLAEQGRHTPTTAQSTDVVCSPAIQAANDQYPPDAVPDDDPEDWITANISRATAFLIGSNTQGGATEGGSLTQERAASVEKAVQNIEFAMAYQTHDHDAHEH